MMAVFSTVLTAEFAAASLVMARSLIRVSSSVNVVLYCLDEAGYESLTKLASERIHVLRFDEIATEQLKRLRAERKINAFCWTLKPVVVEHSSKLFPDAMWSAFADSDMMAFSDILPRLQAAGERSAILCPHAFRYPEFTGTDFLFGFFNAGLIAFRTNEKGREILSWWKERCLEHCPATPEPDAFGDQKYLDQIPLYWPKDISTGFPFLDCAAWNIGKEKIVTENGRATWQSQTILMYHFQGLRIHSPSIVDLYASEFRLSRSAVKLLYRPYLLELKRATQDIRRVAPSHPLDERPISAKSLARRFIETLLGRRNLALW